MDKQIKYKDLSTPLKIAIIFSWVFGMINIIVFLLGFISELVVL